MHFKKGYFFVALVLFLVELVIALFINDRIIRPIIGDYLVVILLYTLLRAFVKVSPLFAALLVLAFSFIIELLQLISIIDILGLSGNQFAKTIIGTSFHVGDLLAYTLGVYTAYLVDTRVSQQPIS